MVRSLSCCMFATLRTPVYAALPVGSLCTDIVCLICITATLTGQDLLNQSFDLVCQNAIFCNVLSCHLELLRVCTCSSSLQNYIPFIEILKTYHTCPKSQLPSKRHRLGHVFSMADDNIRRTVLCGKDP